MQPWTAALGVALTLAGAGYAAWGVARFDPRTDPALDPGFDLPVSRLASVYEPYQQALEQIRPETSTEHLLLGSLQRGTRLSSGFLMLLMRLFLGTLTAVGGLVMLTVVVERRRLLGMLAEIQTGADAVD